MKTRSTDLQIQDLDCRNIQLEIQADDSVNEDKELQDEILQEIIREDEERRKRQAKDEAEFKKKGGKKKEAKKNKKDDL